jgi:hypothetical protein
MKKILLFLSLLLAITFLMHSNLTFASTDSDYIYDLDIRPKHEEPSIWDDSLYYGYVYFDQSFSPDVQSYTATVQSEVKNVKIEVQTVGNLTITGNKEYDLKVGENTIKVVASKSDGTSKTYTIVINRLESEDDNTDLDFLNVYDSYDSNYDNYVKDFDPSITTYHVVVENEITEVEIYGLPSVNTSTIEGGFQDYKLKTGNNKIKLTITSKSGKKKDYIINVERKKSSDVTLLGIAVNGKDISFNGKRNFTIKYLYDTSTVDIKASVLKKTTKIEGSGKHKLKVGNNKIKLTVIAEDGSKDVYNFNIVRAKSSTELSDIMINKYSCGADGNKLTIDVSYLTDKVEIKATAIDKSAKVTGTGTYKLKVWKNTFYITVKAANGNTKKYTIIVNRLKDRGAKTVIYWD